MIIWGTRGRQKELGQGTFFCPNCNEMRPYVHKKASRYFTLYFIPLFETKDLGEFVECQVCKKAFDPKILQPASQSMLKVVASTRYSLLHGTSPEAAKAQLIASGADPQTAEKILEMAQR